ncbi:MAG: rod-binding protein [Planctomycetes bacterium]|nr:rod-binding protein [Planctomycetota bacterium]
MKIPTIPAQAFPSGSSSPQQDPLRQAATELEASFLAEMLKSAGLAKTRSAFGGGAGEDQFGSFLVRAQAEQIARTGGIGLAESLYQALLETNG